MIEFDMDKLKKRLLGDRTNPHISLTQDEIVDRGL